MPRRLHIAALAAALAALALPASAAADYRDVIKDCSYDGKFDRKWSHNDLNEAHKHLPTDIREYTDCKALIEAELAKAGTGGRGIPGGGGPGGLAGPGVGAGTGLGSGGAAVTESGAAGTPAAVASLKQVTRDTTRAKPRLATGAGTIIPAASSLDSVPGSANRLPSPLVLAILAVAVLCTLGGTAVGWRRWPALIRAPLRLFRR